MSDEWVDVTRGWSAFEVHLSAGGNYRHRPRLSAGSDTPPSERQWQGGRPPGEWPVLASRDRGVV